MRQNRHVTVLRGAVRVASEVIDGVAEVEVVDVLSISLECAVLLPYTEPLGLGWCVRRQFQDVEHASELVARHRADVGQVEVVEQRKQLDLRVLHLRTAQHLLYEYILYFVLCCLSHVGFRFFSLYGFVLSFYLCFTFGYHIM